jgi:hypothetical protein
MLTKNRYKTILLSLGLATSLTGWTTVQAADPVPPAAKPAASPPAQTEAPAKQEWRIPTGEHWSKATDTERRAYVLGILNMAMVEYQLSGPNPKHRTTVAKLVKALDGMAVPQIVETIDAYYKANPDKQQQPIIEVIWFQMVAPKAIPAKAK